MKPLSFVIITYNRPADLLELLENISGLESASDLLEEVIVVNNNSSEDYSAAEAFIHNTPNIPFRYFFSNENLGVSKGRNYAFSKGCAPVIIMLDDDAVLQHSDALLKIKASFEVQEHGGREIALVSFKVLYYDTLEIQRSAFPHKKFELYRHRTTFYTYYFAGGAHAIKRAALESAGMLPSDFFYGMEEYDLGYRLIEKGYCIKYDSAIVMLHKESPLGRKPAAQKFRGMWVNKCKVAWRYLPKVYFYSTLLLWGLEFLVQSKFNMKEFLKGIKEISKIPSTNKRSMLTRESLDYLKRTEARLFY